MNNFIDYERPKQSSSIRRGLESIVVVLLGVFLSFLIAGILGAILYFGGFAPLVFPFLSTATSQTTPPSDAGTEISPTSTPTSPQFPTLRPSATPFPTFTSFVLPSWTPSAGPPTFTRTPVPSRTPTRTPVPTRTRTRTATPTFTRTRTATLPPSQTFTPTATFTPTQTPTAPGVGMCSSSILIGPLTNPNFHEIGMDITNSSGSPVTINGFFAYWEKTPPTQQLNFLYLRGFLVANLSDPDSPSDIPNESSWESGADLTIPDGATQSLVIQFRDDLQPTGYEIHLVFDPDNDPATNNNCKQTVTQ